MGKTYIYGIRDLEINKFIYVGKSNCPLCRFKGHMKDSANGDVRKFVKRKGKNNFELEELELVEFEVSEDWIKRERFWITRLREEGHPLCNKNDGGGGPTEVSEETKARMSIAWSGKGNPNYGKDMSGKNNPMYGKRHTEEAKRKNSSWQIEYNRTHDNSFKGKHHTEAVKQKQSKRMLGEGNPNYGKDMSGDNNPFYGKHHAKEWKRKHSERHAKPYPAFYNVKTDRVIPSGVNLTQLCVLEGLDYESMRLVARGKHKQDKDGWRLA